MEIKKKFTSILSYLNTTASYSDSKNYDLDKYTQHMNSLFLLMEHETDGRKWIFSPSAMEAMYNYANSARFNLTKRDVKIHFPKIDLTFFRKSYERTKPV